jgi:hypothetical protein
MGASLDDAWIVAGILRTPVTLRNRAESNGPFGSLAFRHTTYFYEMGVNGPFEQT